MNMKNKKMKIDMSLLKKSNILLIVVLFCATLNVEGRKPDYEKTKTITKEFTCTSNSEVKVSHRRGPLRIQHVDGNQGRLEVKIIVAGEDEADLEKLMNAMSIDLNQSGDFIALESGMDIKSWNSSTTLFITKSKIELKDGTRITSKVDKISIEATLFIPKIRKAVFGNKYDNIELISCQASEVEVDIHSGTFKAEDINADTKVKIKYGKFDLKQVANLTIESHDSKGTLGNIHHLILNDKYSDFSIGNVLSLNANLHDANLILGNVGEDANIIDKYSVIELGNFIQGKWDLHDSKINAGTGKFIKINSKYSDIVTEVVQQLEINSHDDNFRHKEIANLLIVESKYTSYEIGNITESLLVQSSHDDDLTATKVGASITAIDLYGKYSEFEVPLPKEIGFDLDVKTIYGDLSYPEDGTELIKHIEKDSELILSVRSIKSPNQLKIQLVGHDCKFKLD